MFINKALIEFMGGSFRKMLGAVLSHLLMTLIGSAVALLSALLISSWIKNQGRGSEIFWMIGAILCLMILGFVLRKVSFKILMRVGMGIKDHVRTQVLQKLFLLGPATIHSERTGHLASVMTARVEYLAMYYETYLPAVVSSVVNALLFIAFLFRLDVITGITGLIALVMMLVVPMLFFKIMRERGEDEMAWYSRYYSECLDGIQGMTTLKALNADPDYIDFIKDLGERFRQASISHMKVTMTEGCFLEFFARVGTALTIVILAWRVTQGNFDTPYLFFAYFAIGAAFGPMLHLINAWHIGFQGVAGSYSIYDFLHQHPDYVLSNERIPEKLVDRGELESRLERKIECAKSAKLLLKDVSFRYTGESEDAVKELNLTLQPGKTLALVGSSGGGKSTIAGLVAGFYKPREGEITLNQSKESSTFSHDISAVWQDHHLFAGSIKDNIRMGKWDAKDEEIYAAAKKARIDVLIESLPKGFDTETQELGSLFSMGERQRIAIARAFLKDAPLFIFDEATSSLDRENERYIQEILSEIKSEKAVLIIAHRLQTIEGVDEICFLKDGRIVERGTHEALLHNPMYSEFVRGMGR